MLVLIRTIHKPVERSTLAPSMSFITCHELCFSVVILKEVKHIVCLTAKPLTVCCVSSSVSTVVPSPMSAHTYSVTCFMYHRTYSLIASIRTDTHPSAVRAVCCRSVSTIVTSQMETLNPCPLVEIFYCFTDCITATCICGFIWRTFVPRTSASTLRVSDNLHLISISHFVSPVNDVWTQIVHCSRFKSSKMEDISIKLMILGCSSVQNCRIMFRAQTNTTFKNITTLECCTH